MRYLIFFLCLSLGQLSASFGQASKIVQLFNTQLLKERNFYFDEVDKGKYEIIEPYNIKDGILSFSYAEHFNELGGKTIVHRAVRLAQIKSIEKDINLVLFTQENSVLETVTMYDAAGAMKNKTETKASIFQTFISKEKNNEKLKIALLKAFKKAGYPISNEYWYD